MYDHCPLLRIQKDRKQCMNNTYITLNAICKRYIAKNGTVEALKNISLSIPKNEIFGVIGLSGAGKSTLVRCINLLERPDAGEIIIDGENLLQLSKEELRLRRQKIGMIFQHFNLLEQQTVLSNVCFPLEIRGIRRGSARRKHLNYWKKLVLQKRRNAIPLSFQEDRSSALRLQEFWPMTRIFCFATRQQALWIRKLRRRYWCY